MMGHVLSTVSQRLSGAISCVRIDVDKYPALASKYEVQVRTAMCFTQRITLCDESRSRACDIAGRECNSQEGCSRLQALPTLVLFKDGKPIDKVEVRLPPRDISLVCVRMHHHLGRSRAMVTTSNACRVLWRCSHSWTASTTSW